MVSKNLKSSSQQSVQEPSTRRSIQLPGESMSLNRPHLQPNPGLSSESDRITEPSLQLPPQQLPPASAKRRSVSRSMQPMTTSAHSPTTRSQLAKVRASAMQADVIAKPLHRSLPPRQTQSSWNWSIIWIAAIGFSTTMGAIAFQLLTQLPPAPDCEQISLLTSDSEKLYCAQQVADGEDVDALVRGMSLISKWSPDHPLYDEAQSMMGKWSTSLLAIARTKTNQSSLDAAITIVSYIPQSSPVYQEAQSEVAQWQARWQTGEAIYQRAIAAIQVQDWDLASKQITELDRLDFDYWRQNRAHELTSKILTEKQAWQDLKQAETLVGDRQPKQLTQAIDTIRQINPQTEAWKTAEPLLYDWSHQLTAASLAQLSQGNTEAALSLAQHLPPDPQMAPGGFDIVQLSHAQTLAASSELQWEPTLQILWQMFQAVNIAEQIEPSSQFHAQAQTHSQDWAAQLSDLVGLQFATWTASLGHEFALRLAIDQAEQVSPDRPRRLQAQTLAAHWGQEIQRIEDRPLLTYARRLAEPGTRDDLQSAIQSASQIAANRALRPEAEAAIALWTQQLQTLEDQPILDKALQLADQGQLADAIKEAEKIAANRALYEDARTNIQMWQGQIDLARDRTLLDNATALASQNQLTNAINLASQIRPEQALYREAQQLISQWQASRAEIWESWQTQDAARPESPPPSSPPNESSAPSPTNTYDGYYDSRYYDEYYGY